MNKTELEAFAKLVQDSHFFKTQKNRKPIIFYFMVLNFEYSINET